jgi:hypothetical protein
MIRKHERTIPHPFRILHNLFYRCPVITGSPLPLPPKAPFQPSIEKIVPNAAANGALNFQAYSSLKQG